MTSYRRACVCVTVYTRYTHTHTNWNTHARHRTRVRHTLTPLGSFDFFTADFFPLTTRIPHFSPHFFHRFLLHPLPFHLLFFHPLSPFSFLFFSSRDVYQRHDQPSSSSFSSCSNSKIHFESFVNSYECDTLFILELFYLSLKTGK